MNGPAGIAGLRALPADAWHDSQMHRAWRARDLRAVFLLAGRHGMTAQDIADSCGLPPDLVAGIISGRAVPGSGVPESVARDLGMPEGLRVALGVAPPGKGRAAGPPPHLGERLARLRGGAGLTQEALARRAGVSVDVIKKLEQRRKDGARLPTLRALAGGLGVDISALLSNPPSPGEGLMGHAEHMAGVVIRMVPGPADELFLPVGAGTGRLEEFAEFAAELVRRGLNVAAALGGDGSLRLEIASDDSGLPGDERAGLTAGMFARAAGGD